MFMFTQFRAQYPKGSLVTELSAIDHGKFIVRCVVQNDGVTLVTALAAAETVELAEDQARSRALAVLDIDTTTVTNEETPLAPSQVPLSLNQTPTTSTAFSSPSQEQTPPALVSEPAIASDTSNFSFSESKPEAVADYVETMPLVAEEIPFTDELPQVPVESEVESEQEVEAPLSRKKSKTPVNEAPVTSSSPNELETNTKGTPSTASPIDFSEIIARTNVELKRLGWTNQQGRDYLLQTYGKRSRQLLTDDELLDFLKHLESQQILED